MLDLESWEANQLKDVVANLYQKIGFEVVDRHGKLEPGCDLIVERHSIVDGRVLERVGLQVTKGAANKTRITEATYALHKRNPLTGYVVITLRGKAEDFDSYLESIEKDDANKIRVIGRDEIEQMILNNGCTPEFELEKYHEMILSSKAFKFMRQINDGLEISDPEKIVEESECEIVVKNPIKIREKLTLFLRAMESVEKVSRKMADEIVGQTGNDEIYLLFIQKWLKMLEPHLSKATIAVEYLYRYPIIIRLFWSSLPSSFRGFFLKEHKKTIEEGYELFWFYYDFDGEEAHYRGKYERATIINMIYRVHSVGNYFKKICDRLILFNLSTTQRVMNALMLDTKTHSFSETDTG